MYTFLFLAYRIKIIKYSIIIFLKSIANKSAREINSLIVSLIRRKVWGIILRICKYQRCLGQLYSIIQTDLGTKLTNLEKSCNINSILLSSNMNVRTFKVHIKMGIHVLLNLVYLSKNFTQGKWNIRGKCDNSNSTK